MNHAISRGLATCLLPALTLLVSSGADAATTLRMGHIWPAGSAVNQQVFEAWADAIERESDGRLEVQNYPSQTLTPANQAYDSAVNGIADIAITLQGYTAGRFPLTEIVQLPGVSSSAVQGSCILQSLYDEGRIDQEYDDTHVLFLFTTGPAYLHTRDTEIETPTDLQGLRIRRPSEVAGEMLERMGAQPVGMPAPDIYSAMQRGVIDGLSFPFEAMKVFRINELTKYHLQIPYYSGALVATMNQRAYQRLPDDLKTVIDDNSGMAWSLKAGGVFAELDKAGREQALEQGDVIHEVADPLADPDWSGPLEAGTRRYLGRLAERGLDQAEGIYHEALDLRDRCAVSRDEAS
ncbi:TRAP transporter substrate-binding protein [Modicisalibacter coralii]|uniref:TRAP transporter substrate-binding protein n=1 Tax=Modicisalibacter coralii TaxID=2304602 RepID=UPI00100A249A|nr:TRAP transporter substrate-binding protein [Halomonas coralii]